MSLDFNMERWARIREDSNAWWAGQLDRPLIQFVIDGNDPGRPKPDLPLYAYQAFYDLSIPVEAIIDRIDYDLSCKRFLGDAFPAFWPNFGPGVVAAFLGAKLETSLKNQTVWFRPAHEDEIGNLSLQYDPDNIWFNRIESLCKAAVQRWEGSVQIGMTDLGGNLDILSVFRPGGKLILDLYDSPDRVKELTWSAHQLWWRYFDEFNSIIQPCNPGYSTWAGLFSSETHYMLQCDFAYMIGPDMFDEFVKPELEASCKRLKNAFYHLDGPGQLPHLDSLLRIDELKGIQWVPGEGAPACKHWPEVYRKIRDAGKLIQVFGDPETLDAIADQLGSAKGILLSGQVSSEGEAKKCLGKYGTW